MQDEFISRGNANVAPLVFNRKLSDRLIEYHFNRPHAALGYRRPIEIASLGPKVLPINPSRTGTCSMCHYVAKSRGLTEQCEPASASSERPVKNPDSLIYGIRWPANRLTYGQMQTLRQISKDVRVPITQLLKDAVDLYLTVLQRELQAAMVAEQEHAGPSARDNPSASMVSMALHASELIPTEPADENSSTDSLPSSDCHGSTKMIAEFPNNPETILPATLELRSGPKTQLGFIFSGD